MRNLRRGLGAASALSLSTVALAQDTTATTSVADLFSGGSTFGLLLGAALLVFVFRLFFRN